MARLAETNVASNGLSGLVKVINAMSTDVQLSQLPERPDILVSEIFGTLLLGESALDYIHDVRKRLLKPTTVILPQFGTQYAVPIECPALESICEVKSWNGIDMSKMNALRDTASIVFTKKYGFRLSSVPFKRLMEPIPVLTVDFATTEVGFAPLKQTFAAKGTNDGVAHAMLLYWTATQHDAVLSTDPDATRDNFPRDMQWGQALQLLDGDTNSELPRDVRVRAGVMYDVGCISSRDNVVLQFSVAESKPSAEPTPLAVAPSDPAPRDKATEKAS